MQPWVLLGLAAEAVQLAVGSVLEHASVHRAVAALLGFLPGLLWVCAAVALVKAVQKRDELQRRIVLQASAIAFLLTVTLALLFTGLANAGIYHASVSAVVGPAIWTWVVALAFLNWRYR